MSERNYWMLMFMLAVCGLSGSAHGEAPGRPNIVFVYADDLGLGDLSCYGGKVEPTPRIDQMASEGFRFTQYYSASPICSPSRCGVITGQFPARWRLNSYLQTREGNRKCEQADFLDAKAPSLPRAFKQAGYKTAHYGKWHLGGGRDVVDPPRFEDYGYDDHAGTWESPQPHPDITAGDWIWSPQDKVKRWDRTRFFFDKTLEFLSKNEDKPCYVNVWLDDTHTPWVQSEPPEKPQSRPSLRKVLAELDRQVGRFLDELKSRGLDEKTLVIFASDNGPLPTFNRARTTGLRGSKMSLYEGGIRLPFIARWPGKIPAGRVDETTVLCAVDLFPSLCALGNVSLPAGVAFDGQDFSKAIRGEAKPERTRPLFWEYGRNETSFAYPKPAGDRSPQLAIRSGRWKLLTNADGSHTELYDLTTDPKEGANVAQKNNDITNQLKQQVLEWKKGLP